MSRFPPNWLLSPFNIAEPAPLLFKLPSPERFLRVVVSPVLSLRFNDESFEIAMLDALKKSEFADELYVKLPSLIATSPVKLPFAPVRINSPVPYLLNKPVPDICCDSVKSVFAFVVKSREPFAPTNVFPEI